MDVSHNCLVNLHHCVDILCDLEKIKVISMEGNPLTLTKNYRKYVMQKLMGRICYLDGGAIDIKKEAEKAEKIKKAEMRSTAGLLKGNISIKSIRKSDTHDLSVMLDYDPDIKFELSLSVISGISGLFLTEEQIHDASSPYEELDEQYKSTAVWVTFQGLHGKRGAYGRRVSGGGEEVLAQGFPG